MILLALLLAQIVPLPETAGWSYTPSPLSALENPSPPLVIITPGLPLYIPAPWCAGCPVIVYSPRALTLDDLDMLPVDADRTGKLLVPEKLWRWVDAEGCTHVVVHVKTPFEQYNYATRSCPVSQ